jgi:hypothetical protein
LRERVSVRVEPLLKRENIRTAVPELMF